MYADSVFQIGSEHKVCEDYAAHGRIDNTSMIAAISDGCSGGIDTDIGARLLVKELIKQNKKGVIAYNNIIKECTRTSVAMGLDETVLYATIGEVLGFSDNSAMVGLMGDGWILCRLRNNKEWIVIEVDYPSGAPYYPAYLNDEKLDKLYKEQYGTKRKIKISKLSENICDTKIIELEGNEIGTFENDDNYFLSYSERGLFFSTNTDNFDVVMVGSDGWSTWTDTKNSTTWQWIRELTNLKSVTGRFLRRKMNRINLLSKRCGSTHSDDISIAGISFP